MLISLLACTLSHGVRPLGEGAWALEASAGGPVTEIFGKDIPLPLSTLGGAYGVTDTVDVHAGAHTTAAALFGLPAGELGASWAFAPQSGARPRVATDGTLVVAVGDIAEGGSEGGFRALVSPSLLAAWDVGADGRHTVFTGVGALIEPLPAPGGYGWLTTGGRWGLGGDAVGLSTELRWLAPYASNLDVAPEYTGVGGLGAVSIQVGLDARFGGAK